MELEEKEKAERKKRGGAKTATPKVSICLEKLSINSVYLFLILCQGFALLKKSCALESQLF